METTQIRKRSDYFEVGNKKIPAHGHRLLTIQNSVIASDRTLELSVSSDAPYERWFYREILDHSPDAVDLSRFNDGANLLFNHNRDDYIGVIERAWLDGGKLMNKVKFDTHELAQKIHDSVNAGIIRNVSIGYIIDELVLEKQSENGLDTYRATRWTPYETSLVTVPADATVGVGRSFEIVNNIEKPMEESTTYKVETDISINEHDVKRQERDRIRGILAAGKKYGCTELAQRAVDEDMSLEQARSLFLDQVKGKQEPVATTVSPVGMSKKELKRYSLRKAIAYQAGLLRASDAGLELEVSDALAKQLGKTPEGVFINPQELVRADYFTGTAETGGDLIETELLSERFIESLRNMSAILPLGVTYLSGLEGNIDIPRQASFSDAYWLGESDTITQDESTFETIGLRPKDIAVRSKVTRRMLLQSSIDIERFMRNDLITAIALGIDKAIIMGTGTGNEPLGILNYPGVNSLDLGVNGGALDWASVVDMQTQIEIDNAMEGDCAYVFNAITKGKLKTTLDHDTGAGRWIWQDTTNSYEGNVAGYRARCSNQLPSNLTKGIGTNLSAGIFGNFRNVLLGNWGVLDLMTDPYTGFNEAIVQIRAIQTLDFELRRPDYFCVASDITNN